MWGRSRSRRRKRGDGSRGPRTSSCGREVQAGISTASNISGGEQTIVFALLLFIVYAAAAAVISTGLVVAAAPPSTCTISVLAIQSVIGGGIFLPPPCYGGEAAEVVRFMNTEPLPDEVDGATEQWLLEVEKEKQLIPTLREGVVPLQLKNAG